MSLVFRYSKNTSFDGEFFEPSFLQKRYQHFTQTINDPKFGFYMLKDWNDWANQSEQVYQKFTHVEDFVHVGIGGSSLGPEMLVKALKPDSCKRKFTFINNVDPDEISSQFSSINWEKVLFYVVSKSGSTAETMAAFIIITNELIKRGISESEFKNYIVVATDPIKGELRQLAKQWSLATLSVPENLGGRFCVFSSVGFFPAMMADINVKGLHTGVLSMQKELISDDFDQNNLFKLCSVLMAGKQKGLGQTCLMPYSSKLRYLSNWFTQLWAESLGKRLNLSGEEVFEGLTPLSSYGATDQHSQMQLFKEGPRDKFILFVEVLKTQSDFRLENNIRLSAFKQLSPFSLAKLLQSELNGTLKALQEADRPFVTIQMEKRDELHISQLLLFLESLTVLMGDYLNVNPFDQPGVEAGKKYAIEWLQSKS